MKERVLITGASGFIGFHLIKAALDKGLEVCAAVRKNSDVRHLASLNIEYCALDYKDTGLLQKQLENIKCQYIIHAAGTTRASTEEGYNSVNAVYPFHLAVAAGKAEGVNLKKFVFLSSLAAIGPSNEIDVGITEETRPAPATNYGRSKLLAEKKLAELNVPIVILRPTAVYGPRERDILIVLKTFDAGLEMYIGRKDQRLSFVYAGDLADLAVRSLFSQASGASYNVSDGEAYGRYELAECFKRIRNKKTLRLHLPVPLVKGMAYALEKMYALSGKMPALNVEKLQELTAANWICSIDKAKSELGYRPSFLLREGLQETLTWYRNNKWI